MTQNTPEQNRWAFRSTTLPVPLRRLHSTHLLFAPCWPILNVQEVSNFLGLGLSQVYELVKRIDFPAFKVGSRIFVPKDKFLTWLNVQTEEKDSLFYTE